MLRNRPRVEGKKMSHWIILFATIMDNANGYHKTAPPEGTGRKEVSFILTNPSEARTWWKKGTAYGLFCSERYVHAKQIYLICYSENEIWKSDCISKWRLGTILLKSYKTRKNPAGRCTGVYDNWCVKDGRVSFEVTELLLFHLGTYNLNTHAHENQNCVAISRSDCDISTEN